MIKIVIIVLIAHLIMCLISLILALLRIYKLNVAEYIYLLLVPVIGPLSILVLEINKATSEGSEVVVMSKFKLENEIYKSLGIRSEEEDIVSFEDAMFLNDSNTKRSLMMDLVKENVVPVEEALAISSTEVRRRLMMDVLNSNTAAFYDLLEQARLNDDVEVVHYATTAMAELNKQYDRLLERFREKVAEEPDNTDMLKSFCRNYERYLELNILQGHMLEVARNEYLGLIKKLIARDPKEEYYCSMVKQQMLSEDFDAAQESFDEMFIRWPGSENVWLLYIEMFARKGDGETLKRKVNEALREHVYFSSKSRERMAFWLGRELD